MDKLKKVLTIIMIVIFPLGIIYCIGKNLFNGNFVTFLGGVFLAVIGFVVCVIWLRPDIIQSIVSFLGV